MSDLGINYFDNLSPSNYKINEEDPLIKDSFIRSNSIESIEEQPNSIPITIRKYDVNDNKKGKDQYGGIIKDESNCFVHKNHVAIERCYKCKHNLCFQCIDHFAFDKKVNKRIYYCNHCVRRKRGCKAIFLSLAMIFFLTFLILVFGVVAYSYDFDTNTDQQHQQKEN